MNCKPLIEILEDLPDPRNAQGKRHRLSAILAFICIAMLCGQRSYSAIAEWGRNHGGELIASLGFTHRKTPCATTLSNVLRVLDTALFKQKVSQWVSDILALDEGIAIDGKTLRGSKKQGSTEYHLLSAISHKLGLPLMQLSLSEKNNEITAMKELLQAFTFQGKILTMDAMHTQNDTAKRIIQGHGDYLMVVKDNQESLKDDVASILAAEELFGDGVKTFQTLDKGHGRIEERHITSANIPPGLIQWPDAKQVFKIQRLIQRKGKSTLESVYGITSLSHKQADSMRLLYLARNHWSIENRTHWVRDVVFDEDRSQVKQSKVAETMAFFRNLAIGLIRLSGRERITKACRYFEAKPLRALHLLGIVTTC